MDPRNTVERDRLIAAARREEIMLGPEDFDERDGFLLIDGTDATEWVEAMTAP